MPPIQPQVPEYPESFDDRKRRLANKIKDILRNVLGLTLSDIELNAEGINENTFTKLFLIKFIPGNDSKLEGNNLERYLQEVELNLYTSMEGKISGYRTFIFTQIIKKIRMLIELRKLFFLMNKDSILNFYNTDRNKPNLTAIYAEIKWREINLPADDPSIINLSPDDLKDLLDFDFVNQDQFVEFIQQLNIGILNVPLAITLEGVTGLVNLSDEFKLVVENDQRFGIHTEVMVDPRLTNPKDRKMGGHKVTIGPDYTRSVKKITRLCENIFVPKVEYRRSNRLGEVETSSIFSHLIAQYSALHTSGQALGNIYGSLFVTSELPGVITRDSVIFQFSNSSNASSARLDDKDNPILNESIDFYIKFARDLNDLLRIIEVALSGDFVLTAREKAYCKGVLLNYIKNVTDHINNLNLLFNSKIINSVKFGFNVKDVIDKLNTVFD